MRNINRMVYLGIATYDMDFVNAMVDRHFERHIGTINED
jgi:hypothetical protein